MGTTGNFLPIFYHLLNGPSRGLDAQMIAKSMDVIISYDKCPEIIVEKKFLQNEEGHRDGSELKKQGKETRSGYRVK